MYGRPLFVCSAQSPSLDYHHHPPNLQKRGGRPIRQCKPSAKHRRVLSVQLSLPCPSVVLYSPWSGSPSYRCDWLCDGRCHVCPVAYIAWVFPVPLSMFHFSSYRLLTLLHCLFFFFFARLRSANVRFRFFLVLKSCPCIKLHCVPFQFYQIPIASFIRLTDFFNFSSVHLFIYLLVFSPNS